MKSEATELIIAENATIKSLIFFKSKLLDSIKYKYIVNKPNINVLICRHYNSI